VYPESFFGGWEVRGLRIREARKIISEDIKKIFVNCSVLCFRQSLVALSP
jgi:hypothetical protein